MGARRREEIGAIELWLIDLEAAGQALEELESALPRLPGGLDTPAAGHKRHAHIALRILLERVHGRGAVHRVPFVRSHRGKPVLPEISGDFSLAHTAHFALAGINPGGPIGVDLEQLRQLAMSAARQEAIVRAASRLGAVAPSSEALGTLQAWTRLEALAKADGRGIGWALEVFGARVRGTAAEEVTPEGAALLQKLAVTDIEAGPGLHASVALPRGAPVPVLKRLPAQKQLIAKLLG